MIRITSAADNPIDHNSYFIPAFQMYLQQISQ